MRWIVPLALLSSSAGQVASAQDLNASSPSARRQMQAYGACIADGSKAKAAQTLTTDFRSPGYRSALRVLNANNKDCSRLLPRRSTMRSNSLLFAGAMAERLLARDPLPLNARLARAVSEPAPQAYGPGDAIAICVARSAPDDVSRLLATEIGSGSETSAVKALEIAVQLCSRGGPALQTNAEGLRAMIATAAFRTVSLTVAERS